MFSSQHVGLVIHKAQLRTGTNKAGEVTKEAEITLVCEPFRWDLANELGDAVISHLFTDDKEPAVRSELESIQLDPKVPPQRIETFADSRGEVNIGTLKHVEFGPLKVAKVVSEKSGLVWLKASIAATIDLGWKDHRDWLIANFGELRYFSFEYEQEELLESPAREFVNRSQRHMRKDGGITSMEITSVQDGRTVGTRITADKVEPIDRPAGSKADQVTDTGATMTLNGENNVSCDEKMGRWLITVALMMPKHVRTKVFIALQRIGEA